MERLPSFRELFSQEAFLGTPDISTISSRSSIAFSASFLLNEACQEPSSLVLPKLPSSRSCDSSSFAMPMRPSINNARRGQYSEDDRQLLSRLNCNPYETPAARSCKTTMESRHRLLPHQTLALEKVFQTTAFPDRSCRINIAAALGLSPRKVQVWFQNKRQKIRTSGLVLTQP